MCPGVLYNTHNQVEPKILVTLFMQPLLHTTHRNHRHYHFLIGTLEHDRVGPLQLPRLES